MTGRVSAHQRRFWLVVPAGGPEWAAGRNVPSGCGLNRHWFSRGGRLVAVLFSACNLKALVGLESGSFCSRRGCFFPKYYGEPEFSVWRIRRGTCRW